MKFFSWMHKKIINGGQAQTKSNQQEKQEQQYYCHEQRQLLSIGTLGNHEITEKPNIQNQSLMMSEEEDVEDMSDFSQEEVGQLEKELKKLLRKKELSVSALTELPLDRFLNCPSSLEMDRRISNMSSCSSSSVQQDEEEEEVIIDRTIRVIIDRCKTICKERKKEKLGIGKKSISFLFNKMFFLCGNGFNPSPVTSMRDSRMEKLLRTMLSRKFNHSQNKKQLVEGKSLRSRKELESDEIDEQKNGHQWVKTDSEYIVLEI